MNAPQRIEPSDRVAQRHAAINDDLEHWGRWSRDKQAKLKCGSAEGRYRPRNGNIDMGWQYNAPEPSPVMLPNTRLVEIDRAVLRVPDLHRAALRNHYVHKRGARAICRLLAIRYDTFGAFMTVGRDMVENILLRNAERA